MLPLAFSASLCLHPVLKFSDDEGPSGSSDSDALSDDEKRFIIKKKAKVFDNAKQMKKFLKKQVDKIDGFTLIEMGGNAYGLGACYYIAELINDKSSEDLWCADF